MIKRPMDAATLDENSIPELVYPILTSPKLDGIRVLCHPELGPITKRWKPLPNVAVREALSDPRYYGYDGELMLPDGAEFNNVQSAFMKRTGAPDFVFHVFDNFNVEGSYARRWLSIQESDLVAAHPNEQCYGWGAVVDAEKQAVIDGYEGLMLRDPRREYKQGRSTLREFGLVKWKRWFDAEGVVIGFEEQLHNANEATTSELGYTKRSSHKANMEPAGCLGKLALTTKNWGLVRVGTGFTQAQREEIWNEQDRFMGARVEFKYQGKLIEKPRFPVFKRFLV